MAADKSVDSSVSAGSSPDQARRLLLRGGAATAPVLLTIASAPVTAAQCVTTSASTSMSPSGTERNAGKASTCSGLSPALWLSANSSSWPSTILKDSGTFNILFPGGPALMNDPKVTDVLDANYPNEFARACAASMLNVKSSPTKIPSVILTDILLRQIWKDAQGPNGFQATAGVIWNTTQATTWLAKTWGG